MTVDYLQSATQSARRSKTRLAIVVSHPIQYYAPLYQRLAQRDDLAVKVFFTWHDGQSEVEDRGFRLLVAWDIPITDGYDFELVPNVSSDPGTHHFWGLNNPSLVRRIISWQPDVVHITGWAWLSHLLAMRAFHHKGIPVLFRGDSHLLCENKSGLRWYFKHLVLRQVFSWPEVFLVVGQANLAYYQAFGVEPNRLHPCTHSIDLIRFVQRGHELEQEAAQWRRELGLSPNQIVLLFAGKFEKIKRPIELMRTVLASLDQKLALVMVGTGELEAEIKAVAGMDRDRFRVLAFQNQSRMPVVYRLCDLFVLPSARETWGFAVTEALACGRPVLVSDGVGCAADVVDMSCGRVFSWTDPFSLPRTLHELISTPALLAEMGRAASKKAWRFDIGRTEAEIVDALGQIFRKTSLQR
jgi:glycosyltransferase involved in cell wall biosynthesis